MWRRVTPKYLLWALAGLATAGLVLFVLWGGPWLFTQHPQAGLTAEQELKARNDVRTTLVQAVAGLAVASGAIVTYRTFRHTRLEQDRAYKLSQSQQVTESYAKAVEQLGHAEAPVRLGAMYSLERLAQDNPPRRQTIVDVLCAYLRMPYTVPPSGESAADPGNDAPTGVARPAMASAPRHDPAQELQVRQTAQRLLADHLRRPPNSSHEDAQRIEASPEGTFWPGLSLDLTGATLVDFDLSGISIISASFTKTTFSGDARFDRATFSSGVWFGGATFSGDVWFDRATFSGGARFDRATFSGVARFDRVTFSGDARFDRATFSGDARFDGATFSGVARFDGATFLVARFDGATFSGDARFGRATFSVAARFGGATFSSDVWFGEVTFSVARFDGATFSGGVWFVEATFSGVARFVEATFSGDAGFGGATFSGDARFDRATFSSDARFDRATFSVAARFDGVRVLHPNNPDFSKGGENTHWVWPEGWTVRPDADNPSRGTLVSSATGSH